MRAMPHESSGSVTTVITLHQQQPVQREPLPSGSSYSLHLTLHQPEELRSYVDAYTFARSLGEILLANGEENDRLSQQLQLAGMNFLAAIFNAETELPPEVVKTHLLGLKTVLRQGSSYVVQNPARIGNLTGERFALELYCQAYNACREEADPPLLPEDVLPHRLVEGVLSWMEQLEGPRATWPGLAAPEAPPRPPVNELGVRVLPRFQARREEPINMLTAFPPAEQGMDHGIAAYVYTRFLSLMDDRVLVDICEQATLEITEENERLEQRNAEDRARYEESYARLRSDIVEHMSRFDDHLNRITADVAALALAHQQQMGELMQQLSQTKKEVGVLLQNVYQLNVRVSGLEASNRSLYQQNADMQHRINKMRRGPGCVIS